MNIKCGNCKEYHESTQAVRECFQYRMTSATIASYAPMGPVQAKLPLTPASPASPAPVDHWQRVISDIRFEVQYHSLYVAVATEKQVDFANSLLARRVHGLGEFLAAQGNQDHFLRSLPRKAISILINALKDAPVKDGKEFVSQVKDLPEVPAGRYAVLSEDGSVKFYKVDRPTEGRWAGYTFVKVQAGDDFHKVPAQRAILNQIQKQGAEECMLRYGRELGHCGHCGRTLTNDESRAVGIGPICREKVSF